MKNGPKGHQNTRGTAFRPVSDLTSHAQLKMFRPGIRAGVFIWEEFKKFPARLPGQPAFSYEHIEIFIKKRAARRDLGNRVSPVNRAHMKRPLGGFPLSRKFYVRTDVILAGFTYVNKIRSDV